MQAPSQPPPERRGPRARRDSLPVPATSGFAAAVNDFPSWTGADEERCQSSGGILSAKPPPSQPAPSHCLRARRHSLPAPATSGFAAAVLDLPGTDEERGHSSGGSCLRAQAPSLHSMISFSPGDLELPPSPSIRSTKRKTLAELLPSPSDGAEAKTEADAQEALPSPFSPSKRLRAMSLRSSSLNPALAPQPSRRERSGAGVLSTESHHIQQALKLYDLHETMEATLGVGDGGCGTTRRFSVNKPASFAAVVRKEFPSASGEEVEMMLEAVAKREIEREARQALRAAMWSDTERRQLNTLFKTIDVDGSGSISRDEFIEIAALCSLERALLGAAFDAAVASARRRSIRTPGGSRELTYDGFLKVIQDLDEAAVDAVRARVLPFLVNDGADSRLVFDDGAQQLRRLVPGGRTLVRTKLRPVVPVT